MTLVRFPLALVLVTVTVYVSVSPTVTVPEPSSSAFPVSAFTRLWLIGVSGLVIVPVTAPVAGIGLGGWV